MLHSNSKNKRNAVLKYAQLRLGRKRNLLSFSFNCLHLLNTAIFLAQFPFLSLCFFLLRATRQLLILTFWFAQGHFNRSSIVSACFQRDFDITDKRMGWALDKKERKEKGSLEKSRDYYYFAFAGFVPRCFRLFYYYIQGEIVFNLFFVLQKGTRYGHQNVGEYRHVSQFCVSSNKRRKEAGSLGRRKELPFNDEETSLVVVSSLWKSNNYQRLI